MFIDNELGNLSEITTRDGLSFVFFDLKNIQINSLSSEYIKDVDTVYFDVLNAPNLVDVRSFSLPQNSVLRFYFIECEKLEEIGTQNFDNAEIHLEKVAVSFLQGEFDSTVSELKVIDCDSIIRLFSSDMTWKSDINNFSSIIQIENCPLLESIYLKANGPLTDLASVVINDTSWIYNPFGADGLFKTLANIAFAPFIDVSDNSLSEAVVDQILVDIYQATWSSKIPYPGYFKGLIITGNNAPPSQSVIDNIIPLLTTIGWTVQYNI